MQTFIVAIVCVHAWEEMEVNVHARNPIYPCSFSIQINELRLRSALVLCTTSVHGSKDFSLKNTFYK